MNMKKITIVVIDNTPFFIIGIKNFFLKKLDIDIVDTADNNITGFGLICNYQPDIAIVNINCQGKNGIELTNDIIRSKLPTKIIMISDLNNKKQIIDTFRAGAYGYLMKYQPCEDFIKAIYDVYNNKPYFDSDEVRGLILSEFRNMHDINRNFAISLSDTEIHILKLLANGMDTKEISNIIFKSEGTTRNLISEMMQKIEAKNRIQAIIIALKLGFFSLEDLSKI